MELKSSNGMEITLDLLGYQFPKLLGEPYDSNWLRVQVRAVHPRGAWTSVDPTLLTTRSPLWPIGWSLQRRAARRVCLASRSLSQIFNSKPPRPQKEFRWFAYVRA